MKQKKPQRIVVTAIVLLILCLVFTAPTIAHKHYPNDNEKEHFVPEFNTDLDNDAYLNIENTNHYLINEWVASESPRILLRSGNAEAEYQREADGEWLQGTLEQAVADVYSGGTVNLLQDVSLTQTLDIAKDLTLTSTDPQNPRTISTTTNEHGYLLSVVGNVTLTHICIDGGYTANPKLIAERALIAVNGGNLILGVGSKVWNNQNKIGGAGGGVCLISGTLILNGGDITNCHASAGGGIAIISGTCEIEDGIVNTCTATHGGAVYMTTDCMLSLSGGQIASSSGTYGGGVYMIENSICTINGGQITENTGSILGGGIFLCSGQSANPQLYLESGSISKNTCTYSIANGGGGIYLDNGSFTMNGGDISENTAKYCGGGIAQIFGTVTITNGKIQNNKADNAGGGICMFSENTPAYLNIEGGEISGNTAGTIGGGIAVEWNRYFKLSGGTITNNKAIKYYGGGIHITPYTVTEISGNPVVKDNQSPEEGDSGGIYFDGNADPSLNFYATVRMGNLEADAEINWYTWLQYHLDKETLQGKLRIATSLPGITAITPYDISKNHYIDDDYDLILIETEMWLVPRIAAESIVILPETARVKVGNTVELTAHLLPKDATVPITWSSSDETVAVVENGVVTALKPGNITITATIPGGSSDMSGVTVYAEHMVTYDLNGGTSSSGVDYSPKVFEEGTEITVKEAPTKDGHTFIGWVNGTTTYQPNNKIRVDCDITLTAVWQEIVQEYTITYNLNGGTGTDYAEQTVPEGTEITIKQAPTRTGYTFIEWTNKTESFKPGQKITIFENTTFTAQWEKNQNPPAAPSTPSKPGSPTVIIIPPAPVTPPENEPIIEPDLPDKPDEPEQPGTKDDACCCLWWLLLILPFLIIFWLRGNLVYRILKRNAKEHDYEYDKKQLKKTAKEIKRRIRDKEQYGGWRKDKVLAARLETNIIHILTLSDYPEILRYKATPEIIKAARGTINRYRL